MTLRRPISALFLVAILVVAGCGGDDDTITSAGTSGATGASSSSASDTDAQIAARNAQVAIEVYATDSNDSYAGASPETLAQIEPGVAGGGDLEVVSTASSYTVSVLSASGATYSVEGGGGAADYTCEPPGTGDCPDSGKWN
jgi:hypothetical protein